MKRLIKGWLFLWLVMGLQPAVADKVDDYVKAEIQRRNIPGLSLAVVRNGKVIKAKGYGHANLEWKISATPQTVYEIGSLTKQFTAAAVMMLAEEGKLSLDDAISKHLSNTPEAWKGITLRQILSHTSGLKDYLFMPGLGLGTETAKSEFIGKVAVHPLDFTPGETYSYSNTGYYLAGLIIEKVSGQTYEEFLTERIFKPLRMNNTYFANPRQIIPNRANGYQRGSKEYYNGQLLGRTAAGGAGAILSTVLDMAKWDNALNGESLLKTTSLQAIWTPFRLNSGYDYPYGLGWSLQVFKGHRTTSHSGGTIAFSTYILRLPDNKLTIIAFCNRDMQNAGSIAQRVAEWYLPELKLSDAKEIPDPDPALTTALKTWLDGYVKAKPGMELIAPEMKAAMGTARGRLALMGVGQLGQVNSMALIEREDWGLGRQLRYRVRFVKAVVHITFALNKEGKIVFIDMRNE